MVATRRGARVGSPAKNTSDENSGATRPTPSTRSTRRRTLMEENQSQSDSQPDEPKDDSTASSLSSPSQRNTRRSTRTPAPKKQPESAHDEADVSESESCCSVSSEIPATPRTRRKTGVRAKRAVQDEVSEAESCSSAVSGSRRAPRSLRKRVLTSAIPKDDEEPSEVDSCSSAVSLTNKAMVTRSHRKSAVHTIEADQSEPDSCSSGVSGLRRSTRKLRVKPIALSLEETDAPSSPSLRRSSRRKTGVDYTDGDSEGCKSGPSMSPWRSVRCQRKDTAVNESDSESVATDLCVSSPQRAKETPCSSRTGSASSSHAVRVTITRSRVKVSSDISDTEAAKPEEQGASHKVSGFPDLGGDEAEEVQLDNSESQERTIIEEKDEDTTVLFAQDEAVEMLAEEKSTQDVQVMEDRETLQGETEAENAGKLSEDKEPEDIPVERESEIVETVPEDLVLDDVGEESIKKQEAQRSKQDAQRVEDRETEMLQEESVAENSATTSEDKKMKEPEIVETRQDVQEQMMETVREYSAPAVVEEIEKKGVIVIETTEDEQIESEKKDEKVIEKKGVIVIETTEDELEGPSTSSNSQAHLSIRAETSQESQKQMISLLDSSEDEEDSADEGLFPEARSQDDEEAQSEEEDVMCPDEMAEEAEALGNGLFVIDTKPGLRAEKQYFVDAKQMEEEEEEDEEDFVDEEGDEDDDEDSKVLFAPKKHLMQLSSSIDTGLKMKDLGGLYVSFDGNKPKTLSSTSKTQKDSGNQDELLKKSVIVPDFEKKDSVPPYKESRNATKLKRKAEREKTTGDGWFNMRAPELTEELKNDLKALKMRSAMDPKRFYKKNDREGFPKYFQVGTVVDSPVDFYTSRIPKKQRKRTIVEELLADADFRSYNKRKYQEIMTEKAAQAAGKHHKKQKFHKKKTNKS